MNTSQCLRSVARWMAVGSGVVVASYAACVGATWFRYGRRKAIAGHEGADPLLDRYLPAYEVADRHHVRVAAPAEIALSAASEMDLQQSAVVRGIFKARELILGSKPDRKTYPNALLAQMKALGWGVLTEIPGREIVAGAVTRPWEANVVFRALPPEEFATFDEADYVKIAWTLRADPIGVNESVFCTETRVATTDPKARAKFRRYWSCFSPGIVLIRLISLGLVKKEAERRAREAKSAENAAKIRRVA
jgi:hypothetical protein